MAQTLGTSVASLVWAPLAERYGARLVICLSASLLMLIPLLPLASDRFAGVLLVVFFLAGAARGGSQAGFWQYVLDLVQPRDRRVFMGLANTANAPALLMPVLGGAILQWGGYVWLFGAAAVFGAAATVAGLLLIKTKARP